MLVTVGARLNLAPLDMGLALEEAWRLGQHGATQEVPEFRLLYVSRTFNADYLPEICSTNT